MKTNMVVVYPISKDKESFFKYLNEVNQPTWCKDSMGITPTYFYFKCRTWWINTYKAAKNDPLGLDTDIIISNPYHWLGDTEQKNFGVTICIRFDTPFISKQNADTTAALCLDIDLTDLMLVFDSYNNQIFGYFFVLNVNSDIPVYYFFNITTIILLLYIIIY